MEIQIQLHKLVWLHCYGRKIIDGCHYQMAANFMLVSKLMTTREIFSPESQKGKKNFLHCKLHAIIH